MWCYRCFSSSFRVDFIAVAGGGSFEFGPDQFVGQVGVGSVHQSRCCPEKSPEQWYVRVDGGPVFVHNSGCLFGIGAVSSYRGGSIGVSLVLRVVLLWVSLRAVWALVENWARFNCEVVLVLSGGVCVSIC